MRSRFARLAWLLAVVFTMAACGCQTAHPSQPSQPTRPKQSNVPKRPDQPKKPDSVVRLKLVVFYATWCIPCQQAKPTVAQIEATGVEVVRIDIDANSDLVEKYNVSGVPTFILYRDDQQIARTHDVQDILAALPAQRNGQ
jgi:thiol-disulfide isomerase/thioredoxin